MNLFIEVDCCNSFINSELKSKIDLVNCDLFEDQEVFKLIQISTLFNKVSSFVFFNELK